MEKYYLWGLAVGVILAFINTYFLLGALGFPLAWVIIPLVSNCSGESCWGLGIGLGDVLLILISMLIAFVIGYVKKKTVPTSVWLRNILYWFFGALLLLLLSYLIFGVF